MNASTNQQLHRVAVRDFEETGFAPADHSPVSDKDCERSWVSIRIDQ
jgi:hypothetical protein